MPAREKVSPEPEMPLRVRHLSGALGFALSVARPYRPCPALGRVRARRRRTALAAPGLRGGQGAAFPMFPPGCLGGNLPHAPASVVLLTHQAGYEAAMLSAARRALSRSRYTPKQVGPLPDIADRWSLT